MLDPNTRESRGYAFVTMDSLRDAERCIKYLNKTLLDGRYIKVEKVTKNSCSTYSGGADTISIENIAFKCWQQSLSETQFDHVPNDLIQLIIKQLLPQLLASQKRH